jgi:hypothetical protein
VISQESLSVRGIAIFLPQKVSYAHYSSSRRRPRPPVAPALVFFPDGPQVAREGNDASDAPAVAHAAGVFAHHGKALATSDLAEIVVDYTPHPRG